MAFKNTISDPEKEAVIAEALSTPEGQQALMLAGKNPMGWTEIDEIELLEPLGHSLAATNGEMVDVRNSRPGFAAMSRNQLGAGYADVAKLADARDSESLGSDTVQVQLLSSALFA